MSHVETVYLDDMDGFGFEDLCERIFDKAGWGDVQRIGGVADAGRDLIINRGDEGSIIVECKHQPNSSVGRPIVQKLHSAVISSGAAKGIVVTTGRYTDEAIQHAKLLSKETPMELFDRGQLVALAEEAGIRLVIGSHAPVIFYFPASDMVGIKDKLSGRLDGFQSHPRPAADIVRIVPNSFTLEASYVISADIDQDFSTSVGTIHSIHRHGMRLIFNAQSGRPMEGREFEFLAGSTLAESADIPSIACENRKTQFRLGVTDMKSKVTGHIIQRFTANVSYMGRNNVRYTKTCVPGPRSVQINDMKQVFLPRYDLSLNFLKTRYRCSLIQNDHDVMLSSDMYDCKICGEHTEGAALLCNACGNIAHRPKFFRPHSYTCKDCKKTICKNCAFWFRRLLFFKKIVCEDCSNVRPKPGRKLVK